MIIKRRARLICGAAGRIKVSRFSAVVVPEVRTWMPDLVGAPARVADRLHGKDWAPGNPWFTPAERRWLASLPDGLPYDADAGGVAVIKLGGPLSSVE